MKYYIYGLYSTEDNIIRYVGQTKSQLNQRKNEHKCDALTRKIKNHKCNWIRKVYKDGFEIGITLLDEANEKNWVKKEIYWINKLKEKSNLVNQLKGGNCGGIGGKLINYLDYDDAKKFVKNNFKYSNTIKTYKKEYNEKKSIVNKLIPKAPNKVYSLRGTWKGWGDFLSTNNTSSVSKHKNFPSFTEACKIVQKANLKTKKDYKIFVNNKNLPKSPEVTYQKEWIDWEFFLRGNKKIKKFSYNDFCAYIINNMGSLPFITEYENMYKNNKLDKRCPLHITRVYKKAYRKIREEIENFKINSK